MSVTLKRLTCLQCGKDLNSSQTKFCCSSCAATYNNLHRLNTTKGKTKKVKCIDCGKEIEASIHIKRKDQLCIDCKKKKKYLKKYGVDGKVCPICGTINCTNEFCKHPAGRLAQIRGLIRNFGFDKNKLGTLEVFNEYNRIKQNLYDLYINQQKSSIDIAKIYNYKYNIFQILYGLGIPTRKNHEANILSILQGKITPAIDNIHFKAQWYKTWDNREVYLRSSYEIDYAKELDDQKIRYEVESLRIKYFDSQQNEYRCAIPDFYIPSTNTIVEIKSNYTLDIQNMKDKAKSYKELGYNFKLILEHKEVNLIDII